MKKVPSATPAAKSPSAADTPSDRLVPTHEVLRILSCSRSHLYDEMAANRLPAPVKRGRLSLWLMSEINQHMKLIGQLRRA